MSNINEILMSFEQKEQNELSNKGYSKQEITFIMGLRKAKRDFNYTPKAINSSFHYEEVNEKMFA